MLPARQRLRRRRDFSAVYARKKSWANPLLALYVRRHAENSSFQETRRFGFVVSKKVGRRAHERNRVKRRLREVCRLRGSQFRNGYDVVFVARSASAQASYVDIDTAVCQLMHRAGLASASLRKSEESPEP